MPPLQIEHKIGINELTLKHTRQPFREELVKIAFKEASRERGILLSVETTEHIMESVDNMLAAMETTPDTGPSAKATSLVAIRRAVQARLDNERICHKRDAGTDLRAQKYTEGFQFALVTVLDMIGVMEAGEAENG